MNRLVSDSEASGKVKHVFDDIRAHFGMVPNFFRAQAGADPDWLEINWHRWKLIMGKQRSLDRKTKELLAVAVSLVNKCEYCTVAHEAMALAVGASDADVTETKEVVELFASFNRIADSLQVPCDIVSGSARES